MCGCAGLCVRDTCVCAFMCVFGQGLRSGERYIVHH